MRLFPRDRHGATSRLRQVLSTGGGHPDRHLGVELSALAERFLSKRADSTTRARVSRRPDEHGGNQRIVLFVAAAFELSTVARNNSARFRVRREGRPVHHAQQEAAGRPDCAGEFLLLRAVGTGGKTRTLPVAAAAGAPISSRAHGGVLHAAAADSGPRLRVGDRTRRSPLQPVRPGARRRYRSAAAGSVPPARRRSSPSVIRLR